MRTYYRCVDCLEIAVLETPVHWNGRYGLCDCGGGLDLMGTVTANNRLASPELRCKCDRRCTFARGPSCDCVCQGANHGAGMEAEIEVLADRGAVPRLKPRTTLAVRLERVAAFKAALDRARGERKRLQAIAGNWREDTRLKELIDKARWSKCHKVRMALLAEFVTPPAPVVTRPTLNVEAPATIQGGLFA